MTEELQGGINFSAQSGLVKLSLILENGRPRWTAQRKRLGFAGAGSTALQPPGKGVAGNVSEQFRLPETDGAFAGRGKSADREGDSRGMWGDQVFFGEEQALS